MIVRFTLACLLFLVTTISQANSRLVITHVYDGDTVELKKGQIKFKLRLIDIDAPERNQLYGKQARRTLSKLCKNDNIRVTVKISGIDQYQRHLGRLECNGLNAGLYLIKNGLAWHNAKYSSNPITLNAEKTARQKNIGLWKNKKPMPPWVWRKIHSH